MIREIVAYKDYYRDFMTKLSEKEQLKIRRALLLFSDTFFRDVFYQEFVETS